MSGSRVFSRYLAAVALCLGLIGGTALLALQPRMPTSAIVLLGLLTFSAAVLAAWWYWRQNRRLRDSVEQLIDAAEHISRGEFSHQFRRHHHRFSVYQWRPNGENHLQCRHDRGF